MLLRSLGGHLLVPVLSGLLVFTTPLGTGQGVHGGELLHPVLPHAHLVGGQILTDEQIAATRTAASADVVQSQPVSGPAFGAGSGADAAGLGLALGPILPVVGLALVAEPGREFVLRASVQPDEFRDPPQDPPPNLFA